MSMPSQGESGGTRNIVLASSTTLRRSVEAARPDIEQNWNAPGFSAISVTKCSFVACVGNEAEAAAAEDDEENEGVEWKSSTSTAGEGGETDIDELCERRAARSRRLIRRGASVDEDAGQEGGDRERTFGREEEEEGDEDDDEEEEGEVEDDDEQGRESLEGPLEVDDSMSVCEREGR